MVRYPSNQVAPSVVPLASAVAFASAAADLLVAFGLVLLPLGRPRGLFPVVCPSVPKSSPARLVGVFKDSAWSRNSLRYLRKVQFRYR